MLISYKWLSSYFKDPLPEPAQLADVITMHAYTVDRMYTEGDDAIFDIDVLPNRAADSLSHRGVAREVSALLQVPIAMPQFIVPEPFTLDERIKVHIEDPKEANRYVGRIMRGIAVGPSPEWLEKRLASIGKRSINNVVDVTNFVLFDAGQPMHAFDLDKISGGEIYVRKANVGERIITLDGVDVALDSSMLIIADAEGPLAIAGVKGGKKAEITESTKNIVLEAAHFNSVTVRKTARKIGILTDSSKRFENGFTQELPGIAMEEATALLHEIFKPAGISPVTDEYIYQPHPYTTGVSTREVNELLGSSYSDEEVKGALERVGCTVRLEKNPASAAVTLGIALVGTALYRKGASIRYEAPRVFDCSSFTAYISAQSGVSIPRMAVDQYMYGEEMGEKDLSPGDLVFSNTNIGDIHYESHEFFPGRKVESGLDHCGMYIGDGKIVVASRYVKDGGGVAIEELKESKAFVNIVGYRRIPELHAPRFVVTVPVERLDLTGSASLIEEVGRIMGYDTLKTTTLSKPRETPQVNKQAYYEGAIREALEALRYSEVMTYAFVNSGEVHVANPIAEDKGALRPGLSEGLANSLEMNARNLDLLGESAVKIFEIGTVFGSREEHRSLGIGVWFPKKKGNAEEEIMRVLDVLKKKCNCAFSGKSQKAGEGAVYEINVAECIASAPEPAQYGNIFSGEKAHVSYKKLSPYPFIVRDIALWAPAGTKEREAAELLKEHAGPLLAREPRLFDVFEKKDEGKISYAFRLVFQSYEKTLTDDEANGYMEKVNDAVKAQGWTVR